MKNLPYQEAVEQFGQNSFEAIVLSKDEGMLRNRLKYCDRRLAHFNKELERCTFLTYKGVDAYIESCEKLRNQFVWMVESLEEALEELKDEDADWLAV